MNYDNRQLEDLNPQSPSYAIDVIDFYRNKLESIQYVLDQASELIESNVDLNAHTHSNAAMGLKLLDMLGQQVQELWVTYH